MGIKNTIFLERLQYQASGNKNIYTSSFHNGDDALAGIFLLDPESGLDVTFIKKGIGKLLIEVGGTMNDEPAKTSRLHTGHPHRSPSDEFCQVTVEERTQLFGFMKNR